MVFPLAPGCMGMSDLYGHADEAESIATIHAALDAGTTLLDTGDYYAAGHNELLIGRALRDRRDKAIVSVKFCASAHAVLQVLRSDCQQISAHPSERNASWMSARLSYRTRRRRN